MKRGEKRLSNAGHGRSKRANRDGGIPAVRTPLAQPTRLRASDQVDVEFDATHSTHDRYPIVPCASAPKLTSFPLPKRVVAHFRLTLWKLARYEATKQGLSRSKTQFVVRKGFRMARRFLHTASAACVLALSWASFSPTAWAYRTFADDPEIGVAARWPARSVSWDISTDSSGPVDPGMLEAASLAAFQTLSTTPCASGMPFTSAYMGRTASAAPGDGRNTIALVSSDWSARGFPSGRGATTDVQLRRYADGRVEIVEADIYLNVANYQFVSGNPSAGQLDLQAVITHEVMHLLGFLHVCEPDGDAGAPLCSASASQFMSSAVYPDYLGLSSRMLSADDAAGLCALYVPEVTCPSACDAGEVCEGGRCVQMLSEQPCVRGSCPIGVCALYGPVIGRCVAPGSVGAECMTGADCNLGICLTSSLTDGSYCSNPCTTNAECGAGDRCLPVTGRSICVPPAPASGCSIGSRCRPYGAPWGIGFVLLAMWSKRRRHA